MRGQWGLNKLETRNSKSETRNGKINALVIRLDPCSKKRLPHNAEKRRSPRGSTQSTPSAEPFRTQSADSMRALGKVEAVLGTLLSM